MVEGVEYFCIVAVGVFKVPVVVLDVFLVSVRIVVVFGVGIDFL